MENFEKALSRKTLKDEIFEILHGRIIAGKYAPGEWLRQEDIASQLGVSQTPVREALDSLVSAGLAERVPYMGVRVIQLSPEEVADAYAMRLMLEVTAARAAATLIKREQVEGLREAVQKTKTLTTPNDMSQLRQLNRDIHRAIVTASGNALLLKLYDVTVNAFPDWMLYEAMFRQPELMDARLGAEFEEHTAIVEALASGDPQLASAKVAVHILNQGRELEKLSGVSLELLQVKEKQVLESMKI
jgi:DNA-binding GntR family transcriptional regulator